MFLENKPGIYISLGSNRGDRDSYLKSALTALEADGEIRIVGRSPQILTKAVGVTTQPDFLNQVVRVKTALEPQALLDFLKRTEETLGRKTTYRWGPREIDLDILLYEGTVVESENLQIPHPQLKNRPFFRDLISNVC